MAQTIVVHPGTTFGRLTVVSEADPLIYTSATRKRMRRRMLCRCVCGHTKICLLEKLRRGELRSCACLRRETTKRMGVANATHRGTGTRLYIMWVAMRNRCFNPANSRWHRYGGRGITIYGGWLHDFATFRMWIEAHLGPRPTGWSIDRINNNGNYEPGNLRWASPAMQARNRQGGTSSLA